MQRTEVSASVIRETLRAIRFGKPLHGSPLFQLAIVTTRLRKQGTSDSLEQRRWVLSRLLDDVIWTQLTLMRGGERAIARSDLKPETELSVLKSDFAAGNIELEAWSMLHQRYYGRSGLGVGDLAMQIGVSRKTLSRRLELGDQLLAKALHQLERGTEATGRNRHNIPQPLTRFIGREREIAAVRALMVEHRLVTLTGPGGIGKSRLAIRLATDLSADYPDGARFVDLSVAEREGHESHVFANALGVQKQPSRALEDTLAEYLANRRMLLLVDNCEHVATACSELLERLLLRCPNLQTMATSRERLQVKDAATWSVPPLALPSTPQRVGAAEMMHYDATRLFGDRAEPGLGQRLTDERVARIGRICAKLDGIPLAIELAAAQTRHLTLEQVHDHLADRFELLKDGRSAMRAVHESLRATLEWSWELLSEKEQVLLRRLSVFRGGWSLEAADVVCSGDGVPVEDVDDLLMQLVAKSLIEEKVDGREARYTMLETVREYSAEKWVAVQGRDAVQSRHAAYYLRFAKTAETRLRGRQGSEWLDRLGIENANLMAALDGAVATGNADLGLSLCTSLFLYWHIRGQQSQGRTALADVLGMPQARKESSGYAKALWVDGLLAKDQGDATIAIFEECLAVERQTGHPIRIARVEARVAVERAVESPERVAAARSLLLDALEVLRTTGHIHDLIDALKDLAVLHISQGEWDAARTYLEEMLSEARKSRDCLSECHALLGLGFVRGELGHNDAALKILERQIALAEDLDHKRFLAFGLTNLGDCHLRREELRTASAHYRRSGELYHEFGGQSGAALTQIYLGEVALRAGDLRAAREDLASAMRLLRGLEQFAHVSGHTALALTRWAKLEALEGRHSRCLRIYGTGMNWLDSTPGGEVGFIGDDDADHLNAAHHSLGTTDGKEALAEGACLTLNHAIAYALGESTWAEVKAEVLLQDGDDA